MPHPRNALLVFALLGALTLASAAALAAGSGSSSSAQARVLYERARDDLDRNTIDTRRQALRALEQAALLDPTRVEYELTLAQTYYACGFLRDARIHFERVVRRWPDQAAAYQGLGLVLRRDWLKYFDRASLIQAAGRFSRAAELEPGNADLWLSLVPLEIVLGLSDDAYHAAFRAARCDPSRLDVHLAVGCVLQRQGMLHEADSIYRATIPRLRKNVRERFEDIGPVATEADTAALHHLPPAEQPAFLARFWKNLDPDLSTPENEAQLEYWSRVTQAYLLYFDPHRDAWDERGELFARYGAPASVAFSFDPGAERPGMIWRYPELGMSVMMQDRLLSEFYMLPVSRTVDLEPAPDPDSLARRGELLASAGGRGVFHLLPPGSRPLPVEGQFARFEGDAGPRLLAELETPGGPADSLWAEYVVLDSASAEVARDGQALTTSACSPTNRRVGEFNTTLAPGPHLVSLTVRDQGGRIGILRRPVSLAPVGVTLALSDVVVACGRPETRGASSVRIEPNPGARVRQEGPLTAYFEIYRLRPGSDGLAHFEYVYNVRPAGKDTRFWLQKFLAPAPGPLISVSHEEVNLGSLRRQFITVPVAALAPGRYRLEVKVRDLGTDEEAVRSVEFTKGS